MEIKLYKDYNPREPINNIELYDALNQLWKKIDDFFDFDKKGFFYEPETQSVNKHLEENTMAIYLLLDKIEQTTGKLTRQDLLDTIDILLDIWDDNKGINSKFKYDWSNTEKKTNAVKILEFSLAVIKVGKITGNKRYLSSLIKIIKYLVKNYKQKETGKLLSNSTDGIHSWGVVKYTLLLNELYDFFNSLNNIGIYEPELSKVIFNKKSDSYLDFRNQLKYESVKYIEEMYRLLGKPGYGFYRNADSYGRVTKKQVKLYGNSILGISILQLQFINDDDRDLTRDIDEYLDYILNLTNKLWDKENGGFYRMIDFTENKKGDISDTNKNIISNIMANKLLLEYINLELAKLDINDFDDVSDKLLQLLHQLDVGVLKLIQYKNFGALNADNEWKNKEKTNNKLHPIYLLVDLLVNYEQLNEKSKDELSIIRNKISTYLSNKIFLSHNSKDKDIIRVINKKIKENGYTTYFDENENPDKLTNKVRDTLISGIKNSGLIIFFVTKNFSNSVDTSEYIQLEIEEAIKEKERRGNYFQIQVIVDEDVEVPEKLVKFWRKKESIVFKKGEDYKLDVFSYINKEMPSHIIIRKK